MELTANHPDLERQLRLQVLEAWNGFAQASRQSRGISADDATTEGRDFDSFFRYQRALKRFNDLVVFGKMPDGPT
jgi:hypothetical protein